MADPIERRDAHARALRWSHVLGWQIDRLYAARAAAVEATVSAQERRVYSVRDSHPFFELDAETHFVVTAAKQLRQSLLAFDRNDRLAAQQLDTESVRILRNALEHWDNPKGAAAKWMAEHRRDPDAHQWSQDGKGLLAGLIDDDALRRWAEVVYAELRDWDERASP